MTDGSCLCGDVAWRVDGLSGDMTHCHCSMCRKAHGAAFATFLDVPESSFRWLRGEERGRRYTATPGFVRGFCARCGSLIPGDPIAGDFYLPAGCFDGDPGVTPGSHIFVGSRAPWYALPDDGLPRHDENPPGYDTPDVPPRPPLPEAGVAVRGSCLCGGVAFAIGGELRLIVDCHCSRCRKTRGAAHASNLFAPAEGFRWLTGEDLIDTYALPDAEFFRHAFCRVCGASVPRLVDRGARAHVPAGTLDDDPGAREKLHIFCGSKAPWYPLPNDGLPRFEASPPGS